jgi:hypothetical protein
MTTKWIAEARTADTIEKRNAHAEKCPSMVTCDHATEEVNEYGDCFDCDGEGLRMCLCQDWTWEQRGM